MSTSTLIYVNLGCSHTRLSSSQLLLIRFGPYVPSPNPGFSLDPTWPISNISKYCMRRFHETYVSMICGSHTTYVSMTCGFHTCGTQMLLRHRFHKTISYKNFSSNIIQLLFCPFPHSVLLSHSFWTMPHKHKNSS